MAKMNSQFKYMYDAAPSIALVAKDHAEHAGSFNGVAIVLDKLGGYWNTPDARSLADTTFAVVVNVEAIDTTTGDETYVAEIEFGPLGFATSVKPNRVEIKGPGQYVMLVDADTVAFMKQDVAAMRLAVTAAGTTPKIKLHAFIGGRIIN
jgi:hypothetical protein